MNIMLNFMQVAFSLSAVKQKLLETIPLLHREVIPTQVNPHNLLLKSQHSLQFDINLQRIGLQYTLGMSEA